MAESINVKLIVVKMNICAKTGMEIICVCSCVAIVGWYSCGVKATVVIDGFFFITIITVVIIVVWVGSVLVIVVSFILLFYFFLLCLTFFIALSTLSFFFLRITVMFSVSL